MPEDTPTKRCGNCGCTPCMCGVAGFVTYAGYNLEQAKLSVGRGWHAILTRLFGLKPADTQVIQVKEKYGGLRFYLSGSTREYLDLVDAAEHESLQTCETCGKDGEPKTPDGNPYGWWKTVCDTCHPDANYKKPDNEE